MIYYFIKNHHLYQIKHILLMTNMLILNLINILNLFINFNHLY